MALIDDSTEKIPPDWYNGGLGGTYENPYPPDAVGGTMACPTFGEQIERVTDAIATGDNGWATEYASSQLVSANNKYLRLTETATGEQQCLNVDDSSLKRVLTGSASISAYWWDRDDEDVIYYLQWQSPALLKKQIISTGATSTVHNFTSSRGYTRISSGGETQMSRDGKYISLRAPTEEIALVYGFDEGEVVAELDFSAWSGFFDHAISACGKYLKIADFTIPAGYHVIFDTNIADFTPGNPATCTQRTGAQADSAYYIFDANHPDGDYRGGGHNDVGLSPAGDSILFSIESQFTNHIYAYNMDLGTRTKIFDLGWATGGLEVSINAKSTWLDGWVYIGIRAWNADPDPESDWHKFQQEVVRVQWDGSTFERLCHTRTNQNDNDYWGADKATVSEDGKRLFFTSTFRRHDDEPTPANYADVYALNLNPKYGPWWVPVG